MPRWLRGWVLPTSARIGTLVEWGGCCRPEMPAKDRSPGQLFGSWMFSVSGPCSSLLHMVSMRQGTQRPPSEGWAPPMPAWQRPRFPRLADVSPDRAVQPWHPNVNHGLARHFRPWRNRGWANPERCPGAGLGRAAGAPGLNTGHSRFDSISQGGPWILVGDRPVGTHRNHRRIPDVWRPWVGRRPWIATDEPPTRALR